MLTLRMFKLPVRSSLLRRTVINLFILLFACTFVNTSLASGLISPTNENINIDKENVLIHDSNVTNSFVNVTLNVTGSDTLGPTNQPTVKVKIVDKPSAVPPRGCSVHYKVTAINETNVVNFTNATTASSTSSCARKCYLSGCTIAQFLPGSANSGTCRLYYGNEPFSCEQSLKSDNMKQEDATQIQCLRCLAVRRSTHTSTITTPLFNVTNISSAIPTIIPTTTVATTPHLTTSPSATTFASTATAIVTTSPPTATIKSTSVITTATLKSTSTTTTTSEIADNFINSNEIEDLTRKSTFPQPPPTENLFAPATDSLERLLESKFTENLLPSGEHRSTFNKSEKPTEIEKVINPLITPLSNSIAIDIGSISRKLVPAATAFIATTSVLTMGKNKTLIDDVKNGAQPGILPNPPGTPANFNFTDISSHSTTKSLPHLSSIDNQTFTNVSSQSKPDGNNLTLTVNESKTFLRPPAIVEKVAQGDKTSRKFANVTFEINVTNFTSANTTGIILPSKNETDTLTNEIHFANSTRRNGTGNDSSLFNEIHSNTTRNKSNSDELSTSNLTTLGDKFALTSNETSSLISEHLRNNTDEENIFISSKTENVTSSLFTANHTKVATTKVPSTTLSQIISTRNTNRSNVSTTPTTSLAVSSFKLSANISTALPLNNESLQINDVAAEIRSRQSVLEETGGLQNFGGGCMVLFHVTNASAVTNAKFSNTTTASSVSNCARKCYILGCKVAQFIPSASTCRIAFAQKESDVCELAHKEYEKYPTTEPVQIQCFRCSSKKLQSLQNPP